VENAAIEDAAAIAKALAGDPDAYGELVFRHQTRVYRLCLAVLGDVQDAQDASQAVFIKAYRFLDRFGGRCAFSTWLTRIAINECRDELRRRKRRKAASLEALLEREGRLPGALIAPTPQDDSPSFPEGFLERLSPPERDLLEWMTAEDVPSYSDIGLRLGVSVDAVKGRLKRLRQKLRNRFGLPSGDSAARDAVERKKP
jgi:RNA polymerase sigma-70 factor (ECF subfamily)